MPAAYCVYEFEEKGFNQLLEAVAFISSHSNAIKFLIIYFYFLPVLFVRDGLNFSVVCYFATELAKLLEEIVDDR